MQPLSGVIALLMFLFLVHSCTGDTKRDTIVIFKANDTEVPYKDSDGAIKTNKPRDFSVSAFVGGVLDEKEFFAVFCDAHFNVSERLSLTQSATKISYGNDKQWSAAEIFANNTINNEANKVLKSVTAIMKGDKIYALATSVDKSVHLSTQRESEPTAWDTNMFIGTVVNSEKSGNNGKTVTWEKQESLKSLFKITTDTQRAIHFSGALGNGVIMKNGTIVLPVKIPLENNNQGFFETSIIYSADNGTNWHLGNKIEFGSSDGSVVEFGNGKLIAFPQCDRDFCRVFESNNMGATWEESLVFAFVFNKTVDKTGHQHHESVVTVPVDGKDVLLFSNALSTDDNQTMNTLQLWLSDGERILRIGSISEKGKGTYTGNSILAYVGDNLYVTHEINPTLKKTLKDTNGNSGDWKSVIALSPIPHLFESVKNTVRTWRNLDKIFESKGIPVNGIVGFLKNTKRNKTIWQDIYNCVNATVKGGESVSGGFRFNGESQSGAKWPVISQRQNQLYTFTRYQFTLAATVKIHATNDDKYNALLGAAQHYYATDTLIGIGYTKDKKWYTVNGIDWKNLTDVSFELEQEYHIAITLANNVALVYVDGVNITNGTHITERFAIIDHFYFGGLGLNPNEKTSLCTVKNAMLFTRGLEQKEILQLSQVSKTDNLDDPLLDKALSVTNSKYLSAGNKKGKSVGQALGEYHNTTFEKHMNHADGSAIVFGIVSFMCFVCSVIVLAGV